MQPIVVDFPAPFGPSSPNTSPGRAVRERPSTATWSPYCFRRSSISIKVVLQGRRGGWRAPGGVVSPVGRTLRPGGGFFAIGGDCARREAVPVRGAR